MTAAGRDGLTAADAKRLAGKIADITAWDDDHRERTVTYRGAAVLGVRSGTWLSISPRRGGELNIPFSDITAVSRVRRAS
jgi:hypothetical protein